MLQLDINLNIWMLELATFGLGFVSISSVFVVDFLTPGGPPWPRLALTVILVYTVWHGIAQPDVEVDHISFS